jgi:hypothetical protein
MLSKETLELCNVLLADVNLAAKNYSPEEFVIVATRVSNARTEVINALTSELPVTDTAETINEG